MSLLAPFIVGFLVIASGIQSVNLAYVPTWQSLDSRPLPSWYDEAKFGIFIHWGVFSVPSFGSEWFWWDWKGVKSPPFIEFMKRNYPPEYSYADFGPMFTAEFFNASEWASILKASGAKYVVLTSKHHEGYTNWPSKYSWNWNSQDVGPHRDLVGELAAAVRNTTDLKFGLYYSLFEWFNPLYLEDKASHFRQQKYVDMVMKPQLNEIVNKYLPEVVWSDGDWEASDTYWNATEFLAWLYNKSPVKETVVTNDRWGQGTLCKHGGYYTCSDKYNPGVLQKHKWENCFTIDKNSWGYRRNVNIDDFLSINELIRTLAETVSCGGNVLVNVGPAHDGKILPIFEERLRQMGQWLAVNGDAIYGTKPWTTQNDTSNPDVWYTRNDTHVFALVLKWPRDGQLFLGTPTVGPLSMAAMLGLGPLPFRAGPGSKGVILDVGRVASQRPSDWAWVVALAGVADSSLDAGLEKIEASLKGEKNEHAGDKKRDGLR